MSVPKIQYEFYIHYLTIRIEIGVETKDPFTSERGSTGFL